VTVCYAFSRSSSFVEKVGGLGSIQRLARCLGPLFLVTECYLFFFTKLWLAVFATPFLLSAFLRTLHCAAVLVLALGVEHLPARLDFASANVL
jgi:hypothetical protein